MKKFFPQFHVIPSGENLLLYHPESFSLVTVNGSLGKVIERLQEGRSLLDIQQMLNIDGEEVDGVIETVRDMENTLSTRSVETHTNEKPLTLYLNVSNACNLACGYCFANGGTYNSPAGVMGRERAIQAVTSFYDNFGSIGVIAFFGGEPMLQAPMIPEVCDDALAQAERRGVVPPEFSIVTNGTLLSKENVEILSKYRFGVTVSIDGPEEINDLLRPTLKGKGSYSAISMGMQRLRDAGISPNIESTYTHKHKELGFTPKTLLEFFREQFGVRALTIGPAAGALKEKGAVERFYEFLIPAFREAALYSLNSLESDRPIVLYQVRHILSHFLTKTKNPLNQFCYANLGKDLFSVSSTGKIYPCQMMNDQPRFEMGDISNSSFKADPRFQVVQSQFEDINKAEMQCRTCWAKHLCFICLAGVELETKHLRPIPAYRCDLIQGVIEEVLGFIYQAQRDADRWKRICTNALS